MPPSELRARSEVESPIRATQVRLHKCSPAILPISSEYSGRSVRLASFTGLAHAGSEGTRTVPISCSAAGPRVLMPAGFAALITTTNKWSRPPYVTSDR